MSVANLNSVIGRAFIERFASIARSSQPVSSALGGKLDGAAATGAGLRVGARAFTTALQGLNTAVSTVNLASSTLEKLSGITDQLISVAERASSIQSSVSDRRQLNIEFKRLGNQFKKVVNDASVGGYSYLTTTGLSDIFQQLGLDKEQSSSIANLFSKFVSPQGDGSLASEYAQGARSSLVIPSGAYRTHTSDFVYDVERVTPGGGSLAGITDGKITSVNTVFTDLDTYLGQNPSYTSLLVKDTNGSLQGLEAGALSSNVVLMAVNETNGYSVIRSSEDFLGYNGSNRTQLFVVDANGTVVQQLTNNSSGLISYGSADISQNNLKAIVVENNTATLTNSVKTIEVTALGVDPSTATTATLASVAGVTYSKPRINNAGTYAAFYDSSITAAQFVRLSDGLTDLFVASDTTIVDFGFTDEDELTILRGVDPFVRTVDSTVFGSGSYGSVVTSTALDSQFATLETDGNGVHTAGFVAYNMFADATIGISEVGGMAEGAARTFEYGNSDTINSLSLAWNSHGESEVTSVDLGITGILETVLGDTSNQVYRETFNPAFVNGERFTRSTPSGYDTLSGDQITSLFDDERTILTRADAYRALNDLKALKSQINENLEVLQDAKGLIEENITLVRAAAASFLELSDQIGKSSDATSVAARLRDLIRSRAPGVLSQAENLNPLTVAALTSTLED